DEMSSHLELSCLSRDYAHFLMTCREKVNDFFPHPEAAKTALFGRLTEKSCCRIRGYATL
ncbi:MAG: hypothetical protein P8Y63_04565, partial [Deltaproteobacteria bacterium]